MGLCYAIGCMTCRVKMDLQKPLVGPQFFVLGPLWEDMTQALGVFMFEHRGHHLQVHPDTDDDLYDDNFQEYKWFGIAEEDRVMPEPQIVTETDWERHRDALHKEWESKIKNAEPTKWRPLMIGYYMTALEKFYREKPPTPGEKS